MVVAGPSSMYDVPLVCVRVFRGKFFYKHFPFHFFIYFNFFLVSFWFQLPFSTPTDYYILDFWDCLLEQCAKEQQQTVKNKTTERNWTEFKKEISRENSREKPNSRKQSERKWHGWIKWNEMKEMALKSTTTTAAAANDYSKKETRKWFKPRLISLVKMQSDSVELKMENVVAENKWWKWAERVEKKKWNARRKISDQNWTELQWKDWQKKK